MTDFRVFLDTTGFPLFFTVSDMSGFPIGFTKKCKIHEKSAKFPVFLENPKNVTDKPDT